jgi:GntR family transcriptional repressor for pyruvate dehydrogenase complex
MELKPVAKVTAAQLAADQMLTMIRRGIWQPGDQLPAERQLADQLKLGRSTVREALQILTTLHVVQTVPGQGNYVKALRGDELFRPELISLLINDAAILDLIATRQMIEPQTVRLACLRATTEELTAIERVLDDHEKALELGEPIAEYARVFHVMLAETSHNGVAATFIRSILDLLQERRLKDRTVESKHRELNEHREIFRLVKKHDADAAATCLVRHIVTSAISDLAPDRRQAVSRELETYGKAGRLGEPLDRMRPTRGVS